MAPEKFGTALAKLGHYAKELGMTLLDLRSMSEDFKTLAAACGHDAVVFIGDMVEQGRST